MNLVLMPSFTRQGAEVTVPEVTGQSENEAERVLAAQELKLSKISEQWSPTSRAASSSPRIRKQEASSSGGAGSRSS